MSAPAEAMTDLPPTAQCRDCGAALVDEAAFCARCGQETQIRLPRVFDFLREAADETIGLSGRLPRTLGLLLFRPGRLTTEYIAGRRQRYVRPMRLYLSVSLVFFGLLGLATSDLGWVSAPSIEDDAKRLEATEAKQTPAAPAVPSPAGTALPEVDLSALGEPTAARNRVPAASADTESRADAEPDAAKSPTTPADPKTRAADGNGSGLHSDLPWLDRRFEHYKGMPRAQVFRTLKDGMLANAPYAVFLLMPLAAFWYQLYYLLRGRRYAEHLLHAVHLHCFAFCIGSLALVPLPGEWRIWLVPVLGLYIIVAEHRVYGSGWVRATLGTFIGSTLYLIGIGITAAMLAVLALAV